MTEIQKRLFELQDEKYRDFQVKLIPTVDPASVIGVRTPELRKLAKELSKGKSAKGVLYILDEPSTGLSFYDCEKLLHLLNELVDMGNTIIVTEHDTSMLSNCDWIIEMGPAGGKNGGYVIAEGTPLELKNNSSSIIGKYLKIK